MAIWLSICSKYPHTRSIILFSQVNREIHGFQLHLAGFYDVTDKVYVFVSKKSNLNHSHPIAPNPSTFDGQVEVWFVNKLTNDESIFIKN